MFAYGDELVFPICVSDEKFEDSMGLLFFSGLFMVLSKTRNKNKKWFCKSCLVWLFGSVKVVLVAKMC